MQTMASASTDTGVSKRGVDMPSPYHSIGRSDGPSSGEVQIQTAQDPSLNRGPPAPHRFATQAPGPRDFTPKVWDARQDKMSPAYSPAVTPARVKSDLARTDESEDLYYQSAHEEAEEEGYSDVQYSADEYQYPGEIRGSLVSAEGWDRTESDGTAGDPEQHGGPEPSRAGPGQPGLNMAALGLLPPLSTHDYEQRGSMIGQHRNHELLSSVDHSAHSDDVALELRRASEASEARMQQLKQLHPAATEDYERRQASPQAGAKLYVRVVTAVHLPGRGGSVGVGVGVDVDEATFCRLRLLSDGRTADAGNALGAQEFRTTGKDADMGPGVIAWNEAFSFHVADVFSAQLECSVWRTVTRRKTLSAHCTLDP